MPEYGAVFYETPPSGRKKISGVEIYNVDNLKDAIAIARDHARYKGGDFSVSRNNPSFSTQKPVYERYQSWE